MSKRNYSNYSKKTEETPVEETVVVAEAIVVENEAPEIKMVEETVETVAVPETVKGTVANCSKLNVREKAKLNAEIVTIINAGAQVTIDVAKSTKDWFCVTTATGINGFCMKKFVNAKL